MYDKEREICLLNDSFPPIIDGVANAVVNYARVINELGNKVSVVTPGNPDADDSMWEYPVIRYPALDFRKSVGYTAGNPFSLQVQLELKQRNIGLLHSHCPIASNTLGRILRETLSVPLIMTYHTKYDIDIANITKLKGVQAGAIKALVNSVSACDELWTVSDGAGKSIQKLGYQGDYIVMPNGVDVPKGRVSDEKIKQAVKGYDLPEKVPVFIFVGRLMWYKGLRIIIDALAGLNSQKLDFRMVFVGGGGDEAEIKAYTREKRLSDKVIFTGAIRDREELRAWYCRADLFLFPSTFDTNGLVVREAAACSLGSVLVDGSCAAEGVTNGCDGLLISEDAASLAVCLSRIMDDKRKMRYIGEQAADNLYYSWNDAVRKAMSRYETVIENYERDRGKTRHHKLSDEVFTLSGELVDLVAALEEQKRRISDKYRPDRDV